MSNYRSKNNGIRFLFFLLIFGYIAINVANNAKESLGNRNVVLEKEAEVCTTCGERSEELILEDTTNYEIYYLDESQTVDVTEVLSGEVLGFSVDCSNLSVANTLDSIKKLCSSAPGEIDHGNYSNVLGTTGGGVKVGKDTSFELVVVTYPLAFWLGQYVFESSNREIKTYTPEYSSNGQQIDVKYQAKTLAPKESEAFVKEVSGTIRQDFKVTGRLTVDGSDVVNEEEEGEYIVSNTENEPKCKCSEEVSTSDYNVGMSNRIASHKESGGYFRQQIPGGDIYINEEGEACLEKGKDYDLISSGVVVSCIDVVSLFDGFFSAIFSPSKWESCTVGEQECYYDNNAGQTVCKTVKKDDCLDTKNIGVKMTPIFGDPYECTEELCANAFLTYSYKASLSPEQASGKKISSSDNDESLMYFIGTDCVAKIDINGKAENIPVTCLWDASPTLLNYKLQAKDKAPNQEYFPQTFEQHWETTKIAIDESASYYGI